MKKVIVAGLIAGSLCLVTPAAAHESNTSDVYDDAIMHPLRIAYFIAHPIGFAAEWLIGRPFQYIVSRDELRNVFGYKPLDHELTWGARRDGDGV